MQTKFFMSRTYVSEKKINIAWTYDGGQRLRSDEYNDDVRGNPSFKMSVARMHGTRVKILLTAME